MKKTFFTSFLLFTVGMGLLPLFGQVQNNDFNGVVDYHIEIVLRNPSEMKLAGVMTMTCNEEWIKTEQTIKEIPIPQIFLNKKERKQYTVTELNGKRYAVAVNLDSAANISGDMADIFAKFKDLKWDKNQERVTIENMNCFRASLKIPATDKTPAMQLDGFFTEDRPDLNTLFAQNRDFPYFMVKLSVTMKEIDIHLSLQNIKSKKISNKSLNLPTEKELISYDDFMKMFANPTK